ATDLNWNPPASFGSTITIDQAQQIPLSINASCSGSSSCPNSTLTAGGGSGTSGYVFSVQRTSSVSGTCSLSTNESPSTLTISKPSCGTVVCSVTLNKNGDSNYFSVPSVSIDIRGPTSTCCIRRRSRVRTRKGYSFVEDISIGDEVLGISGVYSTVRAIHRYKTDWHEVYSINGGRASTTGFHAIYTNEGFCIPGNYRECCSLYPQQTFGALNSDHLIYTEHGFVEQSIPIKKYIVWDEVYYIETNEEEGIFVEEIAIESRIIEDKIYLNQTISTHNDLIGQLAIRSV
ncbi:MAG: hypothetical protein QM526_02150, partial [Alphaproteobacteria bacterium]|nr:hypothetical protein [Alphaproteobacteria bacterium]